MKIWKSPLWGQKSKLLKLYGLTYQNLCEKGKKPTIKIQLNRAYQFWEKAQKLLENAAFPPEYFIFG